MYVSICKYHMDSFSVNDIESQNHSGWKKPLRLLNPTISLELPSPPLNHVLKHHISKHVSFKYLQGWRLKYLPGQPVAMLDNPFGEKFFLIFNLNLLGCYLRLFPLVLSLVTWEKSPTPASL